MGFFSETIAAFAAGRRPHYAFLIEHDFPSASYYNWTGAGHIEIDGHTYVGKGELVKIGGITFGADDAATPLTITLSGVKREWMIEARTEPGVRGAPQRLKLQFFEPDTLQPFDPPFLMLENTLDTVTYSRMGPDSYEISATSEDVWTAKNTSERANYSHEDQQALFPEDLGLEFVAELVSGTRIKWPDFSNSG